MSDTIITKWPPSDGRDWDCQCARCGSSMLSMDCDNCSDGFVGHDCGDDCCPCLDPEDNVRCDFCDGDGHWLVCASPPEWCEAHPLTGRQDVKRGAVEWFVTA